MEGERRHDTRDERPRRRAPAGFVGAPVLVIAVEAGLATGSRDIEPLSAVGWGRALVRR